MTVAAQKQVAPQKRRFGDYESVIYFFVGEHSRGTQLKTDSLGDSLSSRDYIDWVISPFLYSEKRRFCGFSLFWFSVFELIPQFFESGRKDHESRVRQTALYREDCVKDIRIIHGLIEEDICINGD